MFCSVSQAPSAVQVYVKYILSIHGGQAKMMLAKHLNLLAYRQALGHNTLLRVYG